MDKKYEFNEALAALIELAASSNNKLTTKEIDDAFEGIIDNPDMLEHVYEYLVENRISITGYVAPIKLNVENDEPESLKDEIDSATEQAYINMYLAELEDILPLTMAEEEALIEQAIKSHTPSKDKLVEVNLRLVINMIDNYKGKGVATSDLIQEGNLGLLSGVSTYNGPISATEFHKHLKLAICDALDDALNEEIGASRIGRHLADRANSLDKFSTEFAKENGREATLEELAKGLSLSEEDVRSVMKYSLDALNSTGEE